MTIPFDMFTRIPNGIKIARENYMIAQATRNDKYREIKAQVLTKYEDYLLAKQKLEFQTEITQDEFALYKKSEKDFEDNIIKLEEFNKASAAWVGAQMVKLDFQRGVNVAKIELERLIGIRLEDAIAQVK
jgi:outer membrane protein TolC